MRSAIARAARGAVCLLVLFMWCLPARAGEVTPWRITKDHWDASDEKGWQDFVTRLGAEDCWTLDACLKSSANPYRHTDPRVTFLVDCADVPYFLRAYYAWKNGLPFGWQSAMQSNDGPHGDIRYSSSGNKVVGRSFVPATANGVSAVPILFEIVNTVSTAMYRHDARSDSRAYFTDMYSPRIDREGIRPGSIVYDVNGHVALVWKVEGNGRILIFSSHPDHTLDRTFFWREFLRTGPELGSIFQNWRPIQLVGAKRLANGVLVGGHVEGTPNEEIADFSLEQYTGNPPVDPALWSLAKFVNKGEAMDFHTFVRARMSVGQLEYKPVDEMHVMMGTLCQDLRTRKQAVDLARSEGRTTAMPQPDRLPRNIYGTDGVWELYSTPSRDARLKTAFKEMYDQTRAFMQMKETNNPRLEYAGVDLAGDMLRAFNQENAACPIIYRKTDGSPVTLTIDDVSHRLFKLSFDPYQCIERRWGATDPEELSTCPDGDVKTRWYEAEQPLRNQIDRTYDVEMDSTVDELERGPYGLQTGRGVAAPPEVDVKAFLLGAAANLSAHR